MPNESSSCRHKGEDSYRYSQEKFRLTLYSIEETPLNENKNKQMREEAVPDTDMNDLGEYTAAI